MGGGHAELHVSSSSFGDPAPDEAGKALSLKYKPCKAWEVEGFGDALEKLQSAADAERAALRRAVKAQTKARLQFAREKQWVKFFTKAERPEHGSAPEVVELLVGHRERICVKRSANRWPSPKNSRWRCRADSSSSGTPGTTGSATLA